MKPPSDSNSPIEKIIMTGLGSGWAEQSTTGQRSDYDIVSFAMANSFLQSWLSFYKAGHLSTKLALYKASRLPSKLRISRKLT